MRTCQGEEWRLLLLVPFALSFSSLSLDGPSSFAVVCLFVCVGGLVIRSSKDGYTIVYFIIFVWPLCAGAHAHTRPLDTHIHTTEDWGKGKAMRHRRTWIMESMYGRRNGWSSLITSPSNLPHSLSFFVFPLSFCLCHCHFQLGQVRHSTRHTK